jgi:hypothetical protein
LTLTQKNLIKTKRFYQNLQNIKQVSLFKFNIATLYGKRAVMSIVLTRKNNLLQNRLNSPHARARRFLFLNLKMT